MQNVNNDFSGLGNIFGGMLEQMKSWKNALPPELIVQYSGFCSAFRTAFLKTALASQGSFYETSFHLDGLEDDKFNEKYLSKIKHKLLMQSDDLYIFTSDVDVILLSTRFNQGTIITTNDKNIKLIKNALGFNE